jgi:hypothetical protein
MFPSRDLDAFQHRVFGHQGDELIRVCSAFRRRRLRHFPIGLIGPSTLKSGVQPHSSRVAGAERSVPRTEPGHGLAAFAPATPTQNIKVDAALAVPSVSKSSVQAAEAKA